MTQSIICTPALPAGNYNRPSKGSTLKTAPFAGTLSSSGNALVRVLLILNRRTNPDPRWPLAIHLSQCSGAIRSTFSGRFVSSSKSSSVHSSATWKSAFASLLLIAHEYVPGFSVQNRL